jgi:hypothetical protein
MPRYVSTQFRSNNGRTDASRSPRADGDCTPLNEPSIDTSKISNLANIASLDRNELSAMACRCLEKRIEHVANVSLVATSQIQLERGIHA